MKKALLTLFFTFVIASASTMDCSNQTTQMKEVICSDTKLIILYEEVYDAYYQMQNKVVVENFPLLQIQFVTWRTNMENICMGESNTRSAHDCLSKQIAEQIKYINDISNNPDWIASK